MLLCRSKRPNRRGAPQMQHELLLAQRDFRVCLSASVRPTRKPIGANGLGNGLRSADLPD